MVFLVEDHTSTNQIRYAMRAQAALPDRLAALDGRLDFLGLLDADRLIDGGDFHHRAFDVGEQVDAPQSLDGEIFVGIDLIILPDRAPVADAAGRDVAMFGHLLDVQIALHGHPLLLQQIVRFGI